MNEVHPGKTVDAEWQRWIAENVLLNKDPATIVAAMVRDGFDHALAESAVRSACEHPYIRAARQLFDGRSTGADLSKTEAKIKKRDWVLECCRRTARQSSSFGTVPRVREPASDEFLEHYYSANKPVVIEGAMENWRAISEWTPDRLKQRFGDRLVEVQANRSLDANYERNSANLRKTMPFGEYVDIVESVGCSNDWYMTAKNSGANSVALKELWEDIIQFPQYLTPGKAETKGFFWYGPAGTITPLHHDLTNNFMAQVRGKKAIKLIPPWDLPRLYNDRHCYSMVDLTKIDYVKFPLFAEASILEVVIGPGDLLFLPVGWWHFVQGLTASITMTFTNFIFDNDFYSMYSTYGDL